jgi:hypothetical protein
MSIHRRLGHWERDWSRGRLSKGMASVHLVPTSPSSRQSSVRAAVLTVQFMTPFQPQGCRYPANGLGCLGQSCLTVV